MEIPDELRRALTDELAKPEPDLVRVQQLSERLLGTDPRRARFSVDAGMIARLGRELVARQETALSELVKNSYDADAEKVSVHIARAAHGNFIEINDDGSGMTRTSLVDGFMRLATIAKVKEPLSARFHRQRAGRKGVGRFAAERLGEKLILTTATEGSDEALQLVVEWSLFEAGADLGSVFLPIISMPKTFDSGTNLRIEKLRDAWSSAAVERTFKHVVDLIDPGDQTASAGEGSSFFVQFRLDGAAHPIVDIRQQITPHAYAVIEVQIDEAGNVTWSLNCSRLGIKETDRPLRIGDKEETAVAHARNATMKAHYFILGASVAPTARTTVQSYLAQHGGVTLYRNGFRVPPYGQPGNDWLDLDKIAAARTATLAPFRHRNFLGSVALHDVAGLYEETSSREGIIENSAFEELRRVMQSALLTAVREIDAERDRKKLKVSQIVIPRSVAPHPGDTLVPPGSETAQSGPELAQSLLKAVQVAGTSTSLPPDSKKLVETLKPIAEGIAEETARREVERNALLREIDLLRVLASMGLAIGQFTHEFGTLSGAMRASLAVLLERDRADADRAKAAETMTLLLNQTREFSGLFKSMTEENSLRERQEHDLYELVTSFRRAMTSIFDRNGVQMEIEETGEEVRSPPMHRSEFFAILLNFTTNSIKAIKRSGRAGQILVSIKMEPGKSVIEFQDNGAGVAEDIRERMFDAFVTTTSVSADAQAEEELAVGSGLGLAIVKDIVASAGGEVSLGTPQKGYNTCLRVELPVEDDAE